MHTAFFIIEIPPERLAYTRVQSSGFYNGFLPVTFSSVTTINSHRIDTQKWHDVMKQDILSDVVFKFNRSYRMAIL